MRASLPEVPVSEAGKRARQRLFSRRHEPLFLANWDRALFIHYEADPAALQRDVPFALDLRAGRAYVSVVAFTMRGMRFRFGGRIGEWLCRPIATHEFLNVRTYVNHHGDAGIYFLTEWLSSPLCVQLGPRTFGLPYRLGRHEYRHEHETGTLRGHVRDAANHLGFRYEANLMPGAAFDVCAPGSLDEFLLDRYTAFTSRRSRHRFFHIWHSAWRQMPATVSVRDDSLLAGTWKWFAGAQQVSANYSPGATDVMMGWPHRIRAEELQPRRRGRLETFFEFP
jgi:uncharacterized protein YqjF (DUF2071 family)